jgi:hypothetical protein
LSQHLLPGRRKGKNGSTRGGGKAAVNAKTHIAGPHTGGALSFVPGQTLTVIDGDNAAFQ